MHQRSDKLELIDLGAAHYTSEEYRHRLFQLGRIGSLLGGDRATFWAFKQLSKSPTSILDVGCGGGQLTQKLALLYPQASVHGIDLSTDAISFANEQPDIPHNLSFTVSKTPELNEPLKSVDVVTATLVCHHLSDQMIIDFLKRSCAVAKEAVILNDLHRHLLAAASFSIIAPLCFRNRLILHDGALSIQRSFKREDWLHYLKAAGIPSKAFSLTWHFPFRWILILFPRELNEP